MRVPGRETRGSSFDDEKNFEKECGSKNIDRNRDSGMSADLIGGIGASFLGAFGREDE